jgi:hypothetical protein
LPLSTNELVSVPMEKGFVGNVSSNMDVSSVEAIVVRK